MANKKIFCNVPWTNTHLYWDGTYGGCCCETTKLSGTKYNIKNTSLVKWYSSDTMKSFRSRILSDTPLPECNSCYVEESVGHESRRIKENFKSVIFTEQAFEKSFEQSPWTNHFVEDTEILPIDWHVDFGNECNLACKMCHPPASSVIANQYKKWGIEVNNNPNWTNDTESWNQFLENIKAVPKLNRIHIMGGEPLINKKFKEFVNWLIDNEYSNLSLSFVTNGTAFDEKFIQSLKYFKSVDIEVSLESINSTNNYIRQGSDVTQILGNIDNIKNTGLNVVLRSVPQLLNVNDYYQYIKWAFDKKLSIQSVPLIQPSYLAIQVLPYEIKNSLISKYESIKEYINSNSTDMINTISTGRDINRLPYQLIRECDTIISILEQPNPDNVEKLRTDLIQWLVRWDTVYKLNAKEYYPEYTEFLEHYGYQI